MLDWLRPLLIVALALFAAPRVMAAEGEATVICAADGSRQVILFDLETGAPVEQTIVFETCDHCLTPPMAPGADAAVMPHPAKVRSGETPMRALLSPGERPVAAMARAPPVWMI